MFQSFNLILFLETRVDSHRQSGSRCVGPATRAREPDPQGPGRRRGQTLRIPYRGRGDDATRGHHAESAADGGSSG